MKTALVIPPAPFLINQKATPNLGVVSMATEMKKEGYDVDIIDLLGEDNYEEILKQLPQTYTHFGISSTTPQFPYAYKSLQALRKSHPKAKIAIGGAHATGLFHLKNKGVDDINYEALEEFDAVIPGEGEANFRNMFKDGPKWRNAVLIKDLDSLEIPDRDLIDINSYNWSFNDEPATTIMSQRGCPYQCDFCCGRDIDMYSKVRSRSPAKVLEELDYLNEQFGFTSFMWYDDEININNKRLEELCELLKTRDYKHRAFVRTDQIVRFPETLEMMKQAGFEKLCAGIESGSDEVLKRINKRTTYDMNLAARWLAKNAGIHFEAFMLLGLPGETYKDVMDTKQWLIEAQPDDFDLNVIVPYPGSKIYDDAKWNGKEWEYKGLFFQKPLYSKDNSFYKGVDMQSASNVRTETLSNARLNDLRNEIDSELRK